MNNLEIFITGMVVGGILMQILFIIIIQKIKKDMNKGNKMRGEE